MSHVPLTHHDEKAHRRIIAGAINEIENGKITSTGTVTLTASAATTSVTDRRVGIDSYINFMPRTANAAAELAAGTMYVKTTDVITTTDPPTFTINHANNAQTDRTFTYVILGSELS